MYRKYRVTNSVNPHKRRTSLVHCRNDLDVLHLFPGLIDAPLYDLGSMDEVEIDIIKT